jgi:predicted transposase YbfD/YdcC
MEKRDQSDPEVLERLASTGAIVSIDAMGTPKAIAAKIVEQEADDVVAPKGNQTSPLRATA